jgi:pyridoxamine 5'-phosphate oxidase
VKTRIETLAAAEPALWAELTRAVHERGHAWRVWALATVEGTRAAARSVVLRDVVAERQQLLFYTDTRSPKVAQLRQQPQGTLLAWSPVLNWQLRLEVELSVAVSGLDVSSRWARVKLSPGAQDYLATLPPGTPVDRFEPERGSRAHFAVLTAQVTAMDWLELHPDGHRRARFDADGARWLAP